MNFSSSKQNALIVIRHGVDVDNSKRKNGKRTKTLPNGQKIVYYQDGLTEDEGKKQAESFAKVLPKLVDEAWYFRYYPSHRKRPHYYAKSI